MKDIVDNFIKDKLLITVVYFTNTLLITLFFLLYVDKKVDVLYPILLSIFVYMIYISFDFYRYYRFNVNIKRAMENVNSDMVTETNEHKTISEVINSIHSNYINIINEMKEENKVNNKFFSQWVHNMKTPVSVIEIIIQKLMYKDQTDLKLIEEIREENTKLLNGLDQILNMMRLEDFSMDYVPETVNLYDSLKKVINERKSQFIHNNVFPKVLCVCNSEKILTDAKWNEVMIGQIISNAIKYSRTCNEGKKGSKYVYFHIEKQKKYIVLTIKDDGVGIPYYDINRVFEAFFTGENGRKYKQSTGIGLYICKVISEKLGHEILIESEEGNGTVLQIKYLSKL
ncbi:sensor histidine kinase [Clostridium estertheticum]|uniref:sensor histidine kinase n=1 Tax=Clostridium estertheticum TaxID=238834 RepID=UPI0013E956E8|nr:sensor histidine kinase [Clostridium estertheticum]MBZ9685606.1 sensor histidine kinase [Clostridium estertheticum]